MGAESLDLTGAMLDGLRIVSKIGAGGMGDVWKAHDEDLDLEVAVKVLAADLADDQTFVTRFIREARAVARIDHPNVVRVLQAGKRDWQGHDLRILVMEHVQGKDVLDMLRATDEHCLEPEVVREIALQCAKGLEAAHNLGIIHRDIKPANLIYDPTEKRLKILDFGIARNVQAADLTVPAEGGEVLVVGTPLYMAPEQGRGKRVGAPVDIYALGISMFELLTGDLPFLSSNTFSLLRKHAMEPLPLQRLHEYAVPEDLIELIAQMCAKNPDDRPDAKYLARALSGADTRQSDAADTVSVVNPPELQNNIIARKTSFVGRASEIEKLHEIVSEGARLITVLGPAGVGKTRLAQEYALEHQAQFAGGVCFCDLTDARDLDSLAADVGKGLGIPVMGDPIEVVRSQLAKSTQPALVILDNFEQVTAFAKDTVGSWMQDAPTVTFLVSSREPLYVEGEHTFALAPLGVEAEVNAAVQLFVDRAKSVKRGFALTEDNKGEIEAIVRELDGIPLAIELAAARSSALSPKKILERLPRRFDLLKSRRQDQAQRQLTLHDAIEWSWNLLTPYEQSALTQCAAFRGGFFLEAVEEVIDVSDHEDAPFEIDIVEALVEKCLLTVFEIPALPGETRYKMLESIRQFAQAKQGECKEHQSRHAAYYLDYAEEWNALSRGPEASEALTRIGLEIDNLFAIQDGIGAEDAAIGAKAILMAWIALHNSGPTSQLLPRLSCALEANRGGSPLLVSELQQRLARTHTDYGDVHQARRYAEEAIQSFEEMDTANHAELRARGLVDSHFALGVVLTAIGERELAVEHFLAAEEVAQRSGNKSGLGKAMTNRAIALRLLREDQAAIRLHSETEELYREIGDVAGLAVNLVSRGVVYLNREEDEEAWPCVKEAERLFRERRNQKGTSICMCVRAELELRCGDLNKAYELAKESHQMQAEMGLQRSFEYFRVVTVLVQIHRLLDEAWHTTEDHRGMALAFAEEGQSLGESLNIPRLAERGDAKGQTHRFWQWIDDALALAD